LRLQQYPLVLRTTGLLSILGVVVLFLFYPRAVPTLTVGDVIIPNPPIPVIPPTKIETETPPPLRPAVPLPSEDPELLDNMTIPETEFEGYNPLGEPPPLPPDPNRAPLSWTVRPQPLTPITPRYPALAREMGIEGVVVLKVFIDEKGRVREVEVVRGVPNTGLDEAAIEAVRNTRFRPAQQNDRPVPVWIEIPITFRLQ
jgi:protein TonB